MKKKKISAEKIETTTAETVSVTIPAPPPARQEIIKIDDIATDPNQPRKHFDPVAQAELVKSVALHDLIQPVMVRPNPNGEGYMLVVGERRFRAKKEIFANDPGRDTISCTVRELTDEQALELQVIENLQRKDVHPMEEASTFLFMIRVQGASIAEVAARVGKQDYFVKQRLKLNDLTEGWQQLFFNGKLNISVALHISQMSTEIQDEFYQSKTNKKDINSPDFELEFNNWDFNNRRGKFSDATFKLDDTTLVPEMGACTNCSFNTAAALLFPGDAADARCMNVLCFKKKNEAHFDREIIVAKEEEVFFVKSSYGSTDEISERIGEKVLNQNEYYLIERPELPKEEEFNEEWLEDNCIDPEAPTEEEKQECRSEFQKHLKFIEDEQQGYDEALAKNEFKKAFVVEGNRAGSYLTIQITDHAKKKLKLEGMGANGGDGDAAAEILRLQTKEIRSKELDGEKVWLKINDLAAGSKEALHGEGLSSIDRAAMICAMWNKLGYGSVKTLESVLDGISIKDIVENPAAITIEMFNAACRAFIMGVLPIAYGSHINGNQQKALYGVLQQYKADEINAIEEEQAAAAAKRIQRVNQRIAENEAKLAPVKKEKSKSKQKAAA